MNIIQALILGIIQGLTEFLPISSSGHLILAPWLFHWEDPGLSFDVALHWGTLVAVAAYFWKDYLRFVKAFFTSLAKLFVKQRDWTLDERLSWFLVLASIPGAAAGLVLESKAETVFRNPELVAMTMAGFGIVLYVTDRYSRKIHQLEQINWRKALAIGCAQAVALIPGVSRSGATMTAGLGAGLDRPTAARFSFLLLGPISFGAGLVAFKNFQGVSLPLAAGFLAAAISGAAAIKFLLKYLSSHSFNLFVWYRLLLAGLIFGILLLKN